MILHVSRYDPEFDTIMIYTDDPHDETDELEFLNGHVVDYDSATYKPTGFELLLCARGYLKLPADVYDAETDTLTFGDGVDRAEKVVANGDLVAYWAYAADAPEPDFYIPVAVQLRNASVHLAPVRLSDNADPSDSVAADLHMKVELSDTVTPIA